MSTEKALLAAIWDRPHDDTPRLVYADWLEETGDPANAARAAFIRLQCEAARLDEYDDRRPELEGRAEALRKKHAGAWRRGLPADTRSYPYHRGFLKPKRRKFSPSTFAALPAAAFAHTPTWDIDLRAFAHTFKHFLHCPQVLRVGDVDFLGEQNEDQLVALAACPHAANLRRITLGWNGEWEGLRAVAASPALRSLAELRIDGGMVEAVSDLELFATPPVSDRLTALDVTAIGVGAAGVEVLVRSPGVARLAELSVSHWGIDPAAAAVLAAGDFRGLRELDVSAMELGDAGLANLLRSRALTGLRSLILTRSGLTDAGAAALAAWTGAASLRVLNLWQNRIGPAGAAALARSPYLRDLRYLTLAANPLNSSAKAIRVLRERFVGSPTTVELDAADHAPNCLLI